jgi:glutamate-1-semialdehyde 2,1-aminomutase
MPTAAEVEFAEHLGERVPAVDRWRFTNSGSEAVMMAVRVARAATGRDAVLHFEGCYHGSYDGILDPGDPGVSIGVASDTVCVPIGDSAALLAALDEHGDRLACVVFDAMPGRAGMVPASPDYVALLRGETARRGILLIHDEVITFRLAHAGLHSTYGLEPDLLALGKVIGGGFPVGAVGGRADVLEQFDPRRDRPVGHGGTFSANPVTLRAGLAALELLDEPAIERLNEMGDALRERLRAQGWDVTGSGSLLRVHADDHVSLWWRLYEEGLLIGANGLASMSTPMDDDTVGLVARAFDRVGSRTSGGASVSAPPSSRGGGAASGA